MTTRLWHPFADMAVVKDAEFVITRGEDVWVFDRGGRRYLDGTASLWYANVGHGRREIAGAIAAQLEQLEAYSIFADFANEPALQLADRLASLAPLDDAKVLLGNGGSDAIDTAVKLARHYWRLVGQEQRTHLISRTFAYHGTHAGGTSLGGIEPNRAGWGPLVGPASQVAWDSVDALREEIERVGADRVAAFFAEPVIAAGGVLPPPPGYIEGVAQVCRDAGVLFICDSVVCGFGRLGTWFGIERWDVSPDMIIFAKGVTSGYQPLGGVIAAGHLAEPFWSQAGHTLRHGVTYSGHPVACAAALANLDLLASDGLLERGRDLEADLMDVIAPLADHEAVDEVRGGVGLLATVALAPDILQARPGAVGDLVMHMRDAGVLARAQLSSVAVSPPLTVQREHLQMIGDAYRTALDRLVKHPVAA